MRLVFASTILLGVAADPLPVINIGPLINNGGAINCVDVMNKMSASRSVIAAIGAASSNPGYFALKGHGVSSELIGKVQTLSKDFLSLPLDEQLALASTDSGAFLRQYFTLTSDAPASSQGTPASLDLKSMNSAFVEYSEAMAKISRVVVEAIGDALDMTHTARNLFVDQFNEASTSLTITSGEAPSATGYVTASFVEERVEISFGAAMEAQTGGYIPATAFSPSNGITLAFNFDPNPDLVLDSLVEHLSDEQRLLGERRLSGDLYVSYNVTAVEVKASRDDGVKFVFPTAGVYSTHSQ